MTLLPCYDLNLPIPHFSPTFKDPEFPTQEEMRTQVKLFEGADIFSKELIDFFSSKNLTPYRSQMGYTVPGASMRIHLDGYYVDDKLRTPVYAINWVTNSKNTSMRWYDPKGHPGKKRVTSANTTMTYWDPEDVTLIHEKEVSGPTLVRVDIPHEGSNKNNMPRWCYSLRLAPYVNSWEEAVELFDDLIIK
jgi:hypothetical protein